jgi:DNA-binding NarL/FixJ family response regulator
MMIPDVIRQSVAEQEDMDLVADCRGPMKILQETGRAKADAVILTQQGNEEPSLCSQLLAVYPDLIIVSVTTNMASAFSYRLCSHRASVPIAKDSDFAQALRIVVQGSQIRTSAAR